MLNLRGRSRKRWAASRNQTGSSVAIAAAKILLQVLSSGVIAGAGSVSVNAMARPRGRRRRRERSSVTALNQGPDSKGFGLFSVQRQSGRQRRIDSFQPAFRTSERYRSPNRTLPSADRIVVFAK